MTATKKRIYNPITKTYYQIRIRSTSAGRKGSILRKWSPSKSSSKKKS